MKKFIYILLLIPGFIFYSCSEDDLDPNSVIAGSNAVETKFDKWILANYTYPYNIAIKYKLQDIEASKSYYLAPATPEKCEVLSKILQYIWLETFNEVKGIDFLREHSPKVLLLVGSHAYNSDGTIVQGTAESGMKITLYGVNEINPNNISATQLQRYMKTVIHEFCHILHQKKIYDPEFDKISKDDYIADNWSSSSSTDDIAYSLGFISRYARKSTNEDFVETIAWFVVYGQEYWDSIEAKAGAAGAEKLAKKFTIVKNYLKETWGIDIYELRLAFKNRLESVDMLDLK